MSREAAELVVSPAGEQTARPLPVGVFHLVIADDDLVHRAFRMRSTVCGAVMAPSSLPPSCFEEGGEIDRDPRYCPECVREAVRWSVDVRGCPVSEHRVDLAGGQYPPGTQNYAPGEGAGVKTLIPGESANGAAGHPLPVCHLISSHEVVETWHLHPRYTAECGAVVQTSTPDNADCPNECECWPVYCPACLRAIVRNRAAGSPAPALESVAR